MEDLPRIRPAGAWLRQCPPADAASPSLRWAGFTVSSPCPKPWVPHLSVPEIPQERSYSVHLADINHHDFGFLGTATTGNVAGHYMIAGPNWKGGMPEGIDTVTTTDANIAFAVFQTQNPLSAT